jgi:hypothetical protein
MPLTVSTGQHEYQFSGPFTAVGELSARSGVYLISTKRENGVHKVIDVGESGNVWDRVSNHDRVQCWRRELLNGAFFSALYCDERTRMRVETELRDHLHPPCGTR